MTTKDIGSGKLNAEASRWHARMRSGEPLSEVEGARFRAWCAAHPSHRRAYDEMETLWNELGALADTPEIVAERALLAQMPQPAAARERTRKLRARAMIPLALAASLLVAVGAVLLRPASHFVTGVGQQQLVSLEDGSVATLNTSSELRVRYTSGRRGITLVSGQATFEVAKDASRPFVVQVGDGEVVALGTVFDVYKAADRVTVTLVEGRVSVVPELKASGESPAEVLTAGEQLSYDPANPAPRRSEPDVARVLAWRERKLDFQDTPLAEAIAEANRYSDLKIDLQVPDLAGSPISGIFETGRNDLFAEGLKAYFGLSAETTADRRIVLRRRPAP